MSLVSCNGFCILLVSYFYFPLSLNVPIILYRRKLKRLIISVDLSYFLVHPVELKTYAMASLLKITTATETPNTKITTYGRIYYCDHMFQRPTLCSFL